MLGEIRGRGSSALAKCIVEACKKGGGQQRGLLCAMWPGQVMLLCLPGLAARPQPGKSVATWEVRAALLVLNRLGLVMCMMLMLLLYALAGLMAPFHYSSVGCGLSHAP